MTKKAGREQAAKRTPSRDSSLSLRPMDFVASREVEQRQGWRTRIGQVLSELEAVVFDPWIDWLLWNIQEGGKVEEPRH
jgi:hypothetical protein